MFKRWLAEQLEVPRRVLALWFARGRNPLIPTMRMRMGYARIFRAFLVLEWFGALLSMLFVLGLSRGWKRSAEELLGLGASTLGFGAAIAAFVLFSFRRSGFDTREELEDLHGTLLTREEIAFGLFYPIAVRYVQVLLPPLAILLVGGAVAFLSRSDGELVVAAVYVLCAALYWIVSAFLATMRVWLDPTRNLLRLLGGTLGGLFLRAAMGTMIGMACWMLLLFVLNFGYQLGVLTRSDAEMLTMALCAIGYPILTALILCRDLRATLQRAGHQILTPAAPEIHTPVVAAFAEREAKAELRKMPVLRTVFRGLFWRIAGSGVIIAILLWLAGYGVALARVAAMDAEPETAYPRGATNANEFVAYLLLMPPGYCLFALGALLLAQFGGARRTVFAFAYNRPVNAKTLCTSLALVPGCTIIAFGGLWAELFAADRFDKESLLGVLALSMLPPFVLGSVIVPFITRADLADNAGSSRRRLLVLLSIAAVLWFGSLFFSEPFRDFDFLLLLIGGVFAIAGGGMEWYVNAWPVARQRLHERFGLPNEPGTIIELAD